MIEGRKRRKRRRRRRRGKRGIRDFRSSDQSETFERRRRRRSETTGRLEDRTTFLTSFIVFAIGTLAILSTKNVGLEAFAILFQTRTSFAITTFAMLSGQRNDGIGCWE